MPSSKPGEVRLILAGLVNTKHRRGIGRRTLDAGLKADVVEVDRFFEDGHALEMATVCTRRATFLLMLSRLYHKRVLQF